MSFYYMEHKKKKKKVCWATDPHNTQNTQPIHHGLQHLKPLFKCLLFSKPMMQLGKSYVSAKAHTNTKIDS